MNKRTKATNITKEVKLAVHERDGGCCIICGTPVPWNMSCAHVVPRSSGGLGVVQNIVTLCSGCHNGFDQSLDRLSYKKRITGYLSGIYPDWEEQKLKYRKG
jgi:5-methylcytosine-specific restriction endonuclease McrA